MTKEEYIKEHRKMWNWIAEQIKQKEKVVDICTMKEKYLKLNGFKNIDNNCFACEYVKNTLCYSATCTNCLFIWTDMTCTKSKHSEYTKVTRATDYKEQYRYALIIANLNER